LLTLVFYDAGTFSCREYHCAQLIDQHAPEDGDVDASSAAGTAYFFSFFGAGAPSFSLFTLPFVGLMPVVSIAPLSLAPFVVPGFSMPVCGAGPVFWANAEPHRNVRVMTTIDFFTGFSSGSGAHHAGPGLGEAFNSLPVEIKRQIGTNVPAND
jgi:hypothetical protein